MISQGHFVNGRGTQQLYKSVKTATNHKNVNIRDHNKVANNLNKYLKQTKKANNK